MTAQTTVAAFAAGFDRHLRRRDCAVEVQALLQAHERRGGTRKEAREALDLLVSEGRAEFVLIGPVGESAGIQAVTR